MRVYNINEIDLKPKQTVVINRIGIDCNGNNNNPNAYKTKNKDKHKQGVPYSIIFVNFIRYIKLNPCESASLYPFIISM